MRWVLSSYSYHQQVPPQENTIYLYVIQEITFRLNSFESGIYFAPVISTICLSVTQPVHPSYPKIRVCVHAAVHTGRVAHSQDYHWRRPSMRPPFGRGRGTEGGGRGWGWS